MLVRIRTGRALVYYCIRSTSRILFWVKIQSKILLSTLSPDRPTNVHEVKIIVADKYQEIVLYIQVTLNRLFFKK